MGGDTGSTFWFVVDLPFAEADRPVPLRQFQVQLLAKVRRLL
jgi:hypothetical protein